MTTQNELPFPGKINITLLPSIFNSVGTEMQMFVLMYVLRLQYLQTLFSACYCVCCSSGWILIIQSINYFHNFLVLEWMLIIYIQSNGHPICVRNYATAYILLSHPSNKPIEKWSYSKSPHCCSVSIIIVIYLSLLLSTSVTLQKGYGYLLRIQFFTSTLHIHLSAYYYYYAPFSW